MCPLLIKCGFFLSFLFGRVFEVAFSMFTCSLSFACSCDADPSALAKYVAALVKKDKSEKELKALCIDQLDVFLQKGTHFILLIFLFVCSCVVKDQYVLFPFNLETQPFVDKLFEAVNNRSYLPQQEQPPPPPPPLVKVVKEEPKKDEVISFNCISNK